MIVVDTSVWIDFLRKKNTSQVGRLREFLLDGSVVAVTGIVRMELLRGVSERGVHEMKTSLDELPLIETQSSDFDLAASLFRSARDAGTTVRNAVDCLIAAPCIRTGSVLLHADADFDRLATVSDLRVVST